MGSFVRYLSGSEEVVEPVPLEFELRRRFTKGDTLVIENQIFTSWSENATLITSNPDGTTLTAPDGTDLRWVIKRVTAGTRNNQIIDIDYATPMNNPTISSLQNAIANLTDLVYSRKKSITI